MDIRLLSLLATALVVSGCSLYDLVTNAADAAAGTGLFSDEDARRKEWDGLWNPETSECIRDEKELRPVLQQLDAFESTALEEGREFVVLPTGEKYPIEERSTDSQTMLGPTSTCVSRTSG